MKAVNIHEAKTSLSALIAAAEAGEEIIISRANKPVVRLVPVRAKRGKRVSGLHKDNVLHISEDFDAPLPDEFWLGSGPT